MFETEIKAPRKLPEILRYFGQLFCSYPAVMIAGTPFFILVSLIGLGGDHGFAGYKILVCLFVGPLVGRTVGKETPRLVWPEGGSGRCRRCLLSQELPVT